MIELLKQYENKQPEVVFHWKDPETEAEGWTVINSLRGGAAGGGTRMRQGLDKHEVTSLAKTMEVKFTVAGPQIGGAKSGINFNPNDPRKKGVLKRWYKAVMPLLKNYYGTGGDLNVDEIHEVIPITESYGLNHPQEGVVTGHFSPNSDEKTKKINNLRDGVSKVLQDEKYSPALSRNYVVADMITGYGVAEAVRHFYDVYGGSVKNKTVLVQGWGNVGAAAAFYFAQMGAKVIGIIDREGGLFNRDGFSFDEIAKLYNQKQGNKLVSDEMIPFDQINEMIWDLGAQVFAPCAASRLITQDQSERMIKSGLEVITAGANVPFADQEIFFGPIADAVDNQISIIPDFIANCGMARVFAYLMGDNVELTDEAIFNDTSETIKNAIVKVHQKSSSKTGVAKTGFEIALEQLM